MTEKLLAGDTRRAAQGLLGREIIRRVGKRTIRAVICETEAYYGFHDKASHVSHGKTKRTMPMFGPPGTIYVYLIYGMHYCLNIVTEREDYPAAVLIRGIILMPSGTVIRGPGRVTKALKITKTLAGKNIFYDHDLIVGRRVVHPLKILKKQRIGVEYAEEWAHKPLRYLIQ